MNSKRKIVLKDLANHISAVHSDHPLRVAIDGVDTSGKTTLANELIEPLTKLGRPVIRASIDKFHRPQEERYKRGKNSPEGYYFDSFNNEAVLEKLLLPLGSPTKPTYEDELFDFKTNSKIHSKVNTAPPNSILLFDGVFLLRPELNPYWDLRIFLRIPFSEVLKRAKIRDKELMGEEVEQKYLTRYIPGQKIYLHSIHPEKIADIVIDNTDFENTIIYYK